MSRVRQHFVCSDEELAARRLPRVDIVAEREVRPDEWVAHSSPFRAYRRRLRVEPRGSRWDVEETIEYRLAVPIWGPVLAWPVRNAVRRRRAEYRYWWAPPDRPDTRVATVLGLLCSLQLIDGYLGTVLTQTLTFAAKEFERGNTAQGVVLAVVRVGVLLALAAAALADRRGRRRLIVVAGVGSCVFTALGALSPGLWFLGATQLVARGLSTALGIVLLIVATEEMPARSRAWAASVLVLSAGLGSGIAVWILPIADLDIRAWRVVYLVPLAAIGLIVWAGNRLPETRRFESAAAVEGTAADHHDEPAARQRRRRRLVLLAVSAFSISLFVAPASSLQNDFLADVRGFSAGQISLFTLVTSTPVGLGVIVGGALAEARGRRPVGALGLVLGAVLTVAAYFSAGAALWLLTATATVLGAIAVPALAVYGPELFGTHDRGRANGVIVTVGVCGSAVGLFFAGWMSDRLGGELGPPLALLALGPLAVAALVLTLYPETAGLELEDINPEDRDIARPRQG